VLVDKSPRPCAYIYTPFMQVSIENLILNTMVAVKKMNIACAAELRSMKRNSRRPSRRGVSRTFEGRTKLTRSLVPDIEPSFMRYSVVKTFKLAQCHAHKSHSMGLQGWANA